jgi:hypothetical protein
LYGGGGVRVLPYGEREIYERAYFYFLCYGKDSEKI